MDPDNRKEDVHRTYHHDENAKYLLPNDSPEHRRLDEQSAMINLMLNGRVIHAPLEGQQLRMLDVGCGTGVITRVMADSFPEAECIGLDLSPVPEEIRVDAPKNLYFFQGNVQSESPSQWKSSDGKRESGLEQDNGLFDYVYSRMLMFGVTNWDGYVKIVSDLLKPGGWMEVQESDVRYFDANGPVSEDVSWLDDLRRICEGKGMDWDCGSHAANRMKAAGFEDVQVFKFSWPLGGDSEPTPEGREISRWYFRVAPELFSLTIKNLMMGDASDQAAKEKVEDKQSEMRRCLTPRKGFQLPFYVTVGRKPVQTSSEANDR